VSQYQSKLQNRVRIHKNVVISESKVQFFSVEGHTPSLGLSPTEEGDTPYPDSTPLGAYGASSRPSPWMDLLGLSIPAAAHGYANRRNSYRIQGGSKLSRHTKSSIDRTQTPARIFLSRELRVLKKQRNEEY